MFIIINTVVRAFVVYIKRICYVMLCPIILIASLLHRGGRPPRALDKKNIIGLFSRRAFKHPFSSTGQAKGYGETLGTLLLKLGCDERDTSGMGRGHQDRRTRSQQEAGTFYSQS